MLVHVPLARMTTHFLTRLNDIENIPKDKLSRQISNLTEVAGSVGLSCAELNDVVTCVTTVHLIARSTNKIEEKVRRLQNSYHDIYSILWSARAFVDRTEGHIFRGLSVEDEGDWREYVNLNNSLSVEKHIMFAPYKMLYAYKYNNSLPILKEDVLNIKRNHTPHLIKFIELLRNKLDHLENDDFEYD